MHGFKVPFKKSSFWDSDVCEKLLLANITHRSFSLPNKYDQRYARWTFSNDVKKYGNVLVHMGLVMV